VVEAMPVVELVETPAADERGWAAGASTTLAGARCSTTGGVDTEVEVRGPLGPSLETTTDGAAR
jgi:hypothetical protein